MSLPTPTRAVVDLSAYAHNLEYIRFILPPGCGILAVVKSNAYGHGSVPIAERALKEGAAMLGVATVEEGIALRKAEITGKILVMGQPSADELPGAVEHDLRVTISDMAIAESLGELGRKANKVVPVHCKVDTGMGRQGFNIEDALSKLLYVTRVSHIDIEGVATHFPVADRADDAFTNDQMKAFKQLLKKLDKNGVPYELAHAANGAAIINYPDSAFDMVRPGLMTYGVWPTDTPPEKSPLRRVLRWETRVALLKDFAPGSSIGYGRTYITTSAMRAAVLPVGYADGYKYGLSNRAEVLIRATRCPVRGSVSMDQIVVDVSHVDRVAVGDVATLIGTDGDETITPQELAAHAHTIPYDILTGIGSRVRREYVA